MSDGEVHDAENIRKKHLDLGGFQPDAPTTRRLRKMFPDDDPGWSPGRDNKPEVKPEVARRAVGYPVGDPNRVPKHWEGGEITRVEDIKYGLNASVESRKQVIDMLSAAKLELSDGLASLANLIVGSEDEEIMVACETGYETFEKINEAVAALVQSVAQIESYINKL